MFEIIVTVIIPCKIWKVLLNAWTEKYVPGEMSDYFYKALWKYKIRSIDWVDCMKLKIKMHET